MNKTWNDFSVGQSFSTSALTVTEAHMVLFAGITGDFHPLHMNEELAKQTSFGTRIAQGPLVFSMAVGLVVQADVFEDSVIAWIGADNLKFPKPVIPGDTIHVDVEVIQCSETSKSDKGLATFRYNVKNQRDETVSQADMTFLMHRA